MDTDLSDVRVHEDARAKESASEIRARAFTHKNHIWLGRGESQDNLRLMAHETTHVLQQGGVVRRKPLPISSVSPRIQGGWLSDAWSAAKKAGSKVVAAGKAAVKQAGDLASGAKAWVLKKTLSISEIV